MMLDKLAIFDDGGKVALGSGDLMGAQYGSGAFATYTSYNSYDTIVAGVPTATGATGNTLGGPLLHDIGRGRPMFFLSQINLAVLSAGAATLEVDLITSAAAALTSATVVLPGPVAVPKATLVAGYRFPHKALPAKITQQFLGAQIIIGTAALTQGKITNALAVGTDDHADILGVAP